METNKITKKEITFIIKEEVERFEKIQVLQNKKSKILKQLNECAYENSCHECVNQNECGQVDEISLFGLKFGLSEGDWKKEVEKYFAQLYKKRKMEIPQDMKPGGEKFEKAVVAAMKYKTVEDLRWDAKIQNFVNAKGAGATTS